MCGYCSSINFLHFTIFDAESGTKAAMVCSFPSKKVSKTSAAPQLEDEDNTAAVKEAEAYGEFVEDFVQQIEAQYVEKRQGRQFDGQETAPSSVPTAGAGGGGGGGGGGGPAVAPAALKRLFLATARCRAAGALGAAPDTLRPALGALLGLLGGLVAAGQRADLVAAASKAIECGEAASAEGALAGQGPAAKGLQEALQAFEAAVIGLTIITAPQIDGRLVLEEFQENCLNLLKHHLSKHILPSVDISKLKLDATAASSESDEEENEPKESKRTKLFRPVTRVIMKHLGGAVTELITYLEKLVNTTRLQDNVLLTLSSTLLELFVLEAYTDMVPRVQPLQHAALGALQAVFQRCPAHRQLIVEDVFGLVLRLPTGKRSLRTYSLHQQKDSMDLERGSIQMFTALVLSLVQACVVDAPKHPSEEGKENDKKEDNGHGALAPAVMASQRLLQLFLGRCKDKDKAKDFRPLLHNFVDDLLNVLLLPEWPAAETTLQALCRLLLGDLGRVGGGGGGGGGDANVHFFNMAVDVLAKVCTTVRRHLVAAAANPISLPQRTQLSEKQRSARPDAEGENANCVCGFSLADTFMLDCDRCHRWFHGHCVGVAPKDHIEVWHCSDCDIQMKAERLREQLALQRLIKHKTSNPLGALGVTPMVVDEVDEDHVHNEVMRIINGSPKDDGGPPAGGGEEGEVLGERDVFRQLLLHHLAAQARAEGGGGAARAAQARRFHLARWLREPGEAERTPIWEHFRDQWELPPSQDAHLSEEDLLQSEAALARVARALACGRDLFARGFPALLGRMLALLGQQQSLLRARVVKAIDDVLQVDPLLMSDKVVRNSMIERFRDKSPTVRRAITKLVGKYVLSHPDLLETYHDPLMWCLVDDGVSVRKECVKTFRDILILYPDYPRRAEICWKLVERASYAKETDAIKDSIRNTFQEIWFCQTSVSVEAPAKVSAEDSIFVTPSGGVAHVSTKNLHLDPPEGETVTKGIVKGVAVGVASITKNFEGFGSFVGRILSYKKPYFLIKYEDGDEEEAPFSEIKAALRKAVNAPKNIELPPGWVACPGIKDDSTIFVSPQGFEVAAAAEAWAAHRRGGAGAPAAAAPPRGGGGAAAGSAAAAAAAAALGQVASQVVEVVAGLPEHGWLVGLVKDLVLGQGDAEREKKDRAERQKAAKEQCKKLIGCFIEALVSFDEISTENLSNEEQRKNSRKLISIITTLFIFCKACPVFLLPHVEALFPYLMEVDRKNPKNQAITREEEGRISFLVADIITEVLPMMTNPDFSMLEDVASNLKRIVYSFPPLVVKAAAKCLAIMCSKVTQNTKPIFQLLSQFYGYLLRFSGEASLESVSKNVVFSCQRALIVLGTLTQYYDFPEWDGSVQDALAPFKLPTALDLQSIRRAVYELLTLYLRKKDLATQVTALEALGSTFIGSSRLLLLAQTQGHIEKALGHPHPAAAARALAVFRGVLEAEEDRVETGQARRAMRDRGVTMRDQIKGDQDSDSSIAGGTLQIHEAIILQNLFHADREIRLNATKLMGVMLRQGMMHPLETMQYLVALQAEQDPVIKQEAHKLILTEDEKKSTFLSNRIKDGMFLAYRYQMKQYSKASAVEAIEVQDVNDKTSTRIQSIFSSIYITCIQSNRKKRDGLLQQLVSWFDEGKADEMCEALGSDTPLEQKGSPPSQKKKKRKASIPLDMGFLEFICKTIAHLPFTVLEEAMLVIYLINRKISLNGSVLLDSITTLLRENKIIYEDELGDKTNAPEDAELIKSLDDLPLVTHAQIAAKVAYANALCMLLHLKHYLKGWYGISDDHCQSYNPQERTKAYEKSVCVEALVEFKLPRLQVDDSELSVHGVINSFQTFRRLMQQDPEDFTLNPVADKSRRSRRRSSVAKESLSAGKDDIAEALLVEGAEEEMIAVEVDDDTHNSDDFAVEKKKRGRRKKSESGGNAKKRKSSAGGGGKGKAKKNKQRR